MHIPNTYDSDVFLHFLRLRASVLSKPPEMLTTSVRRPGKMRRGKKRRRQRSLIWRELFSSRGCLVVALHHILCFSFGLIVKLTLNSISRFVGRKRNLVCRNLMRLV